MCKVGDGGQSLLLQIVSIARCAGDAIMDVYNRAPSEVKIEYKTNGSPLTEADQAAHKVIVCELGKLQPSFPVLSEESDEIEMQLRATWGKYWLVDPLDGTKEFLNRNGQFTVNIALIEKGRPILGVVYAPALKRVYYAAVGAGAWMQEEGGAHIKISVAQMQSSCPLRIVASRSHADAQTEAFMRTVGQHELAPTGSSLKFCLVADGSADVYPRFGPTMEWDTAAAQCVVEVAGGVVCDFSGQRLIYNKQDFHNPQFLAVAAGRKNAMLETVVKALKA